MLSFTKNRNKTERIERGIRNLFLFFGLLSMGMWTPAFSLMERSVSDNGSVSATIPSHAITRVSVQNDRIYDVRGPSGAYVVSNDNREGAIFIQPTAAYVGKPFTLFIATEKNNNYVLHLNSKSDAVSNSSVLPHGTSRESDTLLLKPIDDVNPATVQWESSSPYLQMISDVMRMMATDDRDNRLEGYSRTAVAGKPWPLGSIATVTLKTIYRGAHVEGRVYAVTNRTKSRIRVSEREFYRSGDRAIAIKSMVIGPYQTTFLYKVVSRG